MEDLPVWIQELRKTNPESAEKAEKMLEGLEKAEKQIRVMVGIINGRIDPTKATDVEKRCLGWFDDNAFLPERLQELINSIKE